MWPLLKIIINVHRQYRRINDIMNGRQPGERGRSSRTGKKNTPPPPVKKKKIDRSVGEYVEFEEISVEASERTEGDTTTIKYKVEQQITDVEFEELP